MPPAQAAKGQRDEWLAKRGAQIRHTEHKYVRLEGAVEHGQLQEHVDAQGGPNPCASRPVQRCRAGAGPAEGVVDLTADQLEESAVAEGAVALAGATVAVRVSVGASGCVVISSISVFSG